VSLLKGDELNVEQGTASADTLDGTAGADKIMGAAGDDVITDTAGGDDILLGGAGDDIISIERAKGSTDSLRVEGGLGADTINFDGSKGNEAVLSVDGGSGANIFNFSHIFQATILGGNAVDTVTMDTDGYARVHTAAGDDVVTAASNNADARTSIVTGDGNDSVTLASDNDGHYRLALGEGQDSVHQSASTDASAVKLVFWDFDVGAEGDTLDLGDYLDSVISHHHKGDDLFADGHLRLTDGTTADGRAAAVLEIDMDGSKGGENWVKLAVFVGVDAADLTSDNLVGLDPTVTPPSDPFAV
jgi:hypothetical protein